MPLAVVSLPWHMPTFFVRDSIHNYAAWYQGLIDSEEKNFKLMLKVVTNFVQAVALRRLQLL